MKKILFSIFAILGGFAAVTSCSDDFLNLESRTAVLESDYYNSPERLYSGLVAAYDPLEWFDYFYQYNSLPLICDLMSDDVYCGGSNEGDQPILVKTSNFTLTALDVPNQVWTICYSGINRSNIVIAKAKGIEMDEALKAEYVSQATVLKAFYYQLLWKFWGNVVYYDENLSAPYDNGTQETADQIYGHIIDMLDEAIASGGLKAKAPAGSEGIVTKDMAYMLYAETVMYQKDATKYPKALGYMEEIITSERYGLVADYAGIWEESGEWGTESIWEINYISEGGVRDWGAPIATGGSVYPVLIGVPGGTDDYQDGWGFEPVAKTTYDMYDAADIRRDGGILKYDAPSPRWQNEGYYLKKYLARKGGNHGFVASDNLNYGNNVRYYRFAETLLNAAELGSPKAQNYLDRVRTRAGLGTVSATADNIIQERRLEFVGEGKRYWDLVRTGKAEGALGIGTPGDGTMSCRKTVGWSQKKKYWPIPQSEIDRSATKLTQNPYND